MLLGEQGLRFRQGLDKISTKSAQRQDSKKKGKWRFVYQNSKLKI